MILSKARDQDPPVSHTTYIEIIRLAHLQASVPTGGPWSISVTDYSFETMATAPLSSIASRVTLHAVMCREIVPRPNKGDCLDRRMRFPVDW